MNRSYDSVPEAMVDDLRHRRQLAAAVNLLLGGKMNVTLDLVLKAAATETRIVDGRISHQSVLLLSPLSATAAAAAAQGALFVAQQGAGSAVLQHDSSPALDRKFRLAILG